MRSGRIEFRVTGKDALDVFKHESGQHRWQRVPPTEKRGRTQSSTVTVAVLREPSAQEVVLAPKDLQIETLRGSAPGGQHKNKTESAVRVTHTPTGITAYCDSRSQHQSKALALCMLRARIQQMRDSATSTAHNQQRRNQIGSGERCGDKIRTVSEQNGFVSNHLNGKKMDIKRYQRGFIWELH